MANTATVSTTYTKTHMVTPVQRIPDDGVSNRATQQPPGPSWQGLTSKLDRAATPDETC